MYQEKFMKKALKLASKAREIDEVPVGAVIVSGGKVISSAYNQKEHKKLATAHAEILAIEKACKKLGDFRLIGCDIYISLEPCVMCMGAILSARLENVYFGASITNGSISAVEICEKANLNHNINIEGGYLKDESSKILSEYFKSKRK